MDSITVRELVAHTAGLQRGIDDLEISRKLNRAGAPSRLDIIEWIYGTPRLRMPGGGIIHSPFYSNYGYVILTSVVEKASNTDFLRFLRDEILAPMDLTDIWVGGTAKEGTLPEEVTYDAEGCAQSLFEPNLPKFEPHAYGADFILENSEGAGGLVSNALTIARLIYKFAVWGTGNRTINRRYGSFAGTWACAESLVNGIDFVFLFNREVPDETKDSFAGHVAQFLDPDQFPRQAHSGWIARA
jgi:CubicO group peptidase (beta-lactamase class C family)